MKYDSPQCGQDHIGIPSTTRRNAPLPNVRATRRSRAPARPPEAHNGLGFARCAIFLALDDAAREEDIFEIEDREIVIFQFFGGAECF